MIVIKNVFGKGVKEIVAKKKHSPTRVLRNLPTHKLTILSSADDREFYAIPETIAILSPYNNNIRSTNCAITINLLITSGNARVVNILSIVKTVSINYAR